MATLLDRLQKHRLHSREVRDAMLWSRMLPPDPNTFATTLLPTEILTHMAEEHSIERNAINRDRSLELESWKEAMRKRNEVFDNRLVKCGLYGVDRLCKLHDRYIFRVVKLPLYDLASVVARRSLAFDTRKACIDYPASIANLKRLISFPSRESALAALENQNDGFRDPVFAEIQYEITMIRLTGELRNGIWYSAS